MSSQSVASLQASVNRLKHELATMKVDDQIPEAGESLTVADYLLERLTQLGVTVSTRPCFLLHVVHQADFRCFEKHVFGVPGDFNLGEYSNFGTGT